MANTYLRVLTTTQQRRLDEGIAKRITMWTGPAYTAGQGPGFRVTCDPADILMKCGDTNKTEYYHRFEISGAHAPLAPPWHTHGYVIETISKSRYQIQVPERTFLDEYYLPCDPARSCLVELVGLAVLVVLCSFLAVSLLV